VTRAAETDLAEARGLLESLRRRSGGGGADDTLVPFNRISLLLSNVLSRAGLLANVHPDPRARAAAEASEREASALATELSLDPDVYRAFLDVPLEGRDRVTRRLVEHTLRDFRRAGVDRDAATREALRELRLREVELGQLFARNIRDDARRIVVEPAALAGLPADWVAAHPPGPDGRVVVTTDIPDYAPFATYARDAAARLALFREFVNRGWPANEGVLRDLLAVRLDQSRRLGYAHWADYVTEDKMAKSAAVVAEFLDRVRELATPRAAADLERLLERKRRDVPGASSLDQSESAYYVELVKREAYAFDSQEVRPYFEFGRVRDGLLAVTSRLCGIEYRRAEGAETWHPDVEVWDVLADGRPVGRVHLDLHPREGKYKHAAQFTIANGVEGVQLPEAALVGNLPDPRTSAGPALLEHDHVVTLFHEFGHLLHHVIGGRQRWAAFSGVATEWDFVETPSQMLEEWAWDPATLRSFAFHHETGEPIPEDLVERMRASKEFGKGAQTRHQTFLASVSLRLHAAVDPARLDFDASVRDLQAAFSVYRWVPGTHLYASFGHLNGYSAMYYSYLWSLVIAKDVFAEFRRRGMFDPETARRFRDLVLAPGGSKDAAELVQDFLGRPYGFDAFREWLER
jgi:thimet oligopeptidase